jgi:hypothetical protein
MLNLFVLGESAGGAREPIPVLELGNAHWLSIFPFGGPPGPEAERPVFCKNPPCFPPDSAVQNYDIEEAEKKASGSECLG